MNETRRNRGFMRVSKVVAWGGIEPPTRGFSICSGERTTYRDWLWQRVRCLRSQNEPTHLIYGRRTLFVPSMSSVIGSARTHVTLFARLRGLSTSKLRL
jgi:hypothetical protein